MSTVQLPSGPVHYRVTGPADSTRPPVVFVHGILVNHTLWNATADRLAERGVRSYALDLPLGGHPEPLARDADLSPRGVAALILEVLAALDLDDVTLVGNDTGGALCQFVVDADPTRIGALVLTNCDAFDQFPPAPFGALVAICRRPGRIRALLPGLRWALLRNGPLGFGPLATTKLDALSAGWVQPLEQADIRRDTAKFMAAIRPADLLDVSTRLPAFAKPVLLVWGEADRFFKLASAERLRATFPAATLVTVPESSTFVPCDAPDRLAAEIHRFIPALP